MVEYTVQEIDTTLPAEQLSAQLNALGEEDWEYLFSFRPMPKAAKLIVVLARESASVQRPSAHKRIKR